MSKEIEEIRKRYPADCICNPHEYPKLSCPIHGIDVYKDIQTLLSELEKEKERVKALEEEIGYIKHSEVYEVKRLFEDPDKEIERLLQHLDISIAAGREGWKRLKILKDAVEKHLRICPLSAYPTGNEELHKILEEVK